MDITNLTLERLKSLAYDTMVKIEQEQKNLSVVNGEIAKKANAEAQSKENAKNIEVAKNAPINAPINGLIEKDLKTNKK